MTTRLAVTKKRATRLRDAAAWSLFGLYLGLPSPLHAAQDAMTSARTPLPAESPLAGPLWTFVVPLTLFVIAFGATLALYRRFSRL